MKIYSLKLSWDRVLKYKWRHIGKEKEAQNWFVQFSLWVPFINCSVDSCFSWCAPPRKLFRMCLDKDGILAETYPIHTNVSLNQAWGKRIVEGMKGLSRLRGELDGVKNQVHSAWEQWIDVKETEFLFFWWNATDSMQLRPVQRCWQSAYDPAIVYLSRLNSNSPPYTLCCSKINLLKVSQIRFFLILWLLHMLFFFSASNVWLLPL